MLPKFTRAVFAAKVSAVGEVTYLLWSGILISTAVRAVVVAKLEMLGILFLTSFILAIRAAVIDKLVIPGSLFLTSFILALRVILVAKLVVSGI